MMMMMKCDILGKEIHGQTSLEATILASTLASWFLASVSASASRHYGLGLKVFASASKFSDILLQLGEVIDIAKFRDTSKEAFCYCMQSCRYAVCVFVSFNIKSAFSN